MTLDRRRRHDQGFTLIELLIVIAIIGVLAAIAVPIFLSQSGNAAAAAAESQASALESLMLGGLSAGEDPLALSQYVTSLTEGAVTYETAVGTMTVTDGVWVANAQAANNWCASVTVDGVSRAYGTGAVYQGAETACSTDGATDVTPQNPDFATAQAQAQTLQRLVIRGNLAGDGSWVLSKYVTTQQYGSPTFTTSYGSTTITNGPWGTNFQAADAWCVYSTVGSATVAYGTGFVFNGPTSPCATAGAENITPSP